MAHGGEMATPVFAHLRLRSKSIGFDAWTERIQDTTVRLDPNVLLGMERSLGAFQQLE